MPFSATSASKFYLFLVALAVALLPATAAAADTLTANPTSLTFAHVAGTPLPDAQAIAVTLPDGSTPADLSATITPGASKYAGLFQSRNSGTGVLVYLDSTKLGTLETAGEAKPYTATISFGSAQGSNQPTVSLTVSNTPGTPFSLSSTAMSFTAPYGNVAPLTQPLAFTSTNSQTAWSASASTTDGGNWLSVNPTNGIGSGSVTVTVNPYLLGYNTYFGTITITPSGMTPLTASVTLTIGTTGSLSFSPSSLTFNFSTGGSLPAAQQVSIAGASGATFTAQPSNGATWLRINGSNAQTGQLAFPQTLNISVDPTNIAATVSGSVILSSTDGSTASIPVTLIINGATGVVSLSTNSVLFTSAVGVTPNPQSVTVSTTAATAAYTAVSNVSWLYVGAPGTYSTSGIAYLNAPSPLYLYVNPSGLVATTYLGTVTVTAGGSTYTINVSYIVGGSGGGTITGFIVAPTQLNYAMQSGLATGSQKIAVIGTAGTVYTIGSSQTWLQAVPDSTAVPATITVTVDPATAPTTPGSYSGLITLSTGTQTQTVYVNLTVVAGGVVVANPGAIVVNYDPASLGSSSLYQYITLTSSSGAGAISYSATSSASWLSVYGGSSGNTPGSIAVLISPSNLAVGANTATVTILGGASSVSVPVTVIVAGSGGNGGTGSALTLNPTSLTFSTAAGSSPAAQQITVSAAANASFTVAPTSDGNGFWLRADPQVGVAGPGQSPVINITVDGSEFIGGSTHTGTLTFSVNGASQTVPVTVSVAASLVTMSVTNTSPSFDYQVGSAVPAAQDLSVTSSGGAIGYSAAAATTSGGNWLSVSSSQGNTPGTVRVSANPQGLAAGTYRGTVTVTAAGASNSPITRNVTLTVREAANLSASVNSFSYTYNTDGGAVPAAQTVAITSTGSTALNFTATSNSNWLSVTPANGVTPQSLSVAVNPAGVAPGRYTGQITVASTGTTASSVTLDVSFTVTAPLPTVTRVVSAGSYADGPLTGGLIIALFGRFMGPDSPVTQQLDSNGRVATTLSDTRVFVSGYPCPLTLVSSTQAKAVVPYALINRTTGSVWVQYQGVRSNAVPVDLALSAPAIFTVNDVGTGQGIIANQDGSSNSASNAAARGSTVIINITGEGQTTPAGVDGKMNDATNLPKAVLPVSVTIDGQPARLVDYGGTPNLVAGNSRVVVEVPQAARTGSVPVIVQVGNARSQDGVTIALK